MPLHPDAILNLNDLAVQKAKFKNYVDHCIAGRRFPKDLFATVGKEVKPGVTVRMSNCDYTATETGNFIRTEIPVSERSPARSQMYVPAKPRRNDKYGNMRLTGGS